MEFPDKKTLPWNIKGDFNHFPRTKSKVIFSPVNIHKVVTHVLPNAQALILSLKLSTFPYRHKHHSNVILLPLVSCLQPS